MAYQQYGGYMPMMYAQNPNPQQMSFTYVIGIEGAKAFPVMAGQQVFLMDSEAPVAYIKSADMNGRPSLEIFDLVKRTEEVQPEEPKIDMSQYVLRSDIEAMVADAVDKAMANFTMTPTKTTKRGSANNG